MPTQQQDASFSYEMDSHVQTKTTALDAAIFWIRQNLEPEDIFSEKQLSNWAEANGYIKE